jgi:hypothetical protein
LAVELAGFVAMAFLVADFLVFRSGVTVLAATFFRVLEGVTATFGAAFALLAESFAVLGLDLDGAEAAAFEVLGLGALGEAVAPCFGVPLGIMLPTACTAFEPASITTSAAIVAISPIRTRTPLGFRFVFFFAIGCSSSNQAELLRSIKNPVARPASNRPVFTSRMRSFVR